MSRQKGALALSNTGTQYRLMDMTACPPGLLLAGINDKKCLTFHPVDDVSLLANRSVPVIRARFKERRISLC